MNRPGITKRRGQGASTIGADMSVRYPRGFTNMSISPYGRDVVLGSQDGLAIIDLEWPLNPPRTVRIDSRWKIAAVSWCPSTTYHGWVGTTVNQTLLIHDLAHTTAAGHPLRVLNAHPMAITDIAWAPLIPAWVGTASIDPVVKIWDVRRDQKPVWFYTEWESANKLAFNNVDMHLLATVHRNKIAVWDIRHGSSPLVTIPNAHADDICSVSWHPTLKNTLVSAGLDSAVKRWSVEHGHPTEEYSHEFGQQNEILGARYLPFGKGGSILVTSRSPSNTATIIRDDAQLSVEHQFVGHEGTILGAEWRMDGGNRVQLVTWGQDRTLRMWALDSQLVERIGGGDMEHCGQPQQSHHGYEQTPSFASNFLAPDQVMHVLARKQFPSDVLLAANSSVSTMHEFGNTLAGIRQGGSSDRAAAPAGGAAGLRTGTPDDHSSDDDDDDDDEARAAAAAESWFDEVEAVGELYRESKAVAVKAIDRDRRQCRLAVGVPWMARQTVRLRITFPPEYPGASLAVAIEASGGLVGASELLGRMAGVADACAARGAKALHRCVHALAMQLVSKARPKGGAHSKQQDDYERLLRQLPAPPAEPASRSGRSAGKGGGAKSAPLAAAASLASEDDDDEYYYSDVEDREDEDEDEDEREDGDEDEDEEDEDEEEEEEEEDYDMFGFDDAYGLDASDNSQAQRHAHSRDRFDAHTPFPRLCGGVFSGAGQLVCFFASAYTRDTYPAGARRAAYRAEMSQQLRAQAKPRTLARLGNYQSMVQLGLQGSGLFFAYPSRRRRASASASAGAGAGARGDDDEEMLGADDDDDNNGSGDDDDDDDAAPRFYFRPHAPAQAQAVAELGNVALICHVAAATAADAALARDFVLGADADADAEAVCRHNARVAARRGGRAALAHTWTLLACLLAQGGGLGSARLWATHAPVARWVRAAVAHYAALGDVQTAALLSCVLSQAAAHAPPAPPPMAAVVEAVRAAIVSRAEDTRAPAAAAAAAAPEDGGGDPIDCAIDAALADALGRAVAGVDATLGRRGVGGALSADLRRMAVLQAVYPGVAICEVPPLLAGSDWAPGLRSPELLRELDSDEIRQSELMMMEREQQQPVKQQPVEQQPVEQQQQQQQPVKQQQQQEPMIEDDDHHHHHARPLLLLRPPAAAENLWDRLRSNVLGRVQTVPASTPPPNKPTPTLTPTPTAAQPNQHFADPESAAADSIAKVGRKLVSADDAEQTYLRARRKCSRPRTRMVSHTAAAAAEEDDDLVRARFPEQWKLVYARTLYRWEMDTKAVEVLKCIEDTGTRRLYTQLQCQPTEPQHDNLPRCGISSSKDISSSSSEPSSATRGAPWLTCSWCHEYVHGRALICHACGHGGHQLHMLRWFRSARKQLTRIGLAPVNGSRFGASNSNSSSSSNLGLLARPTAGAGSGAAFSPELAPLLPAPLSGILRQKPALAVMSPTHDPACDDAAANRALLLDMQTTTTTMATLPPAAGHLSRRGSKANILSQPASSDSSVAGYSDDDDDDFGYGVQSMLLSSRADDDDDDDMQQQQRQQQEWDSSDVDSDDHLHTHPRAAAEVRQLSKRRSPPPATPPLQRLDGDEAFDMQLEIPTCPTGCGCNCIYESRRLIM